VFASNVKRIDYFRVAPEKIRDSSCGWFQMNVFGGWYLDAAAESTARQSEIVVLHEAVEGEVFIKPYLTGEGSPKSHTCSIRGVAIGVMSCVLIR
jgi:hypothetical protein